MWHISQLGNRHNTFCCQYKVKLNEIFCSVCDPIHLCLLFNFNNSNVAIPLQTITFITQFPLPFSQKHRTSRVGKALQNHLVQSPTYQQYFPTKPCPVPVLVEGGICTMMGHWLISKENENSSFAYVVPQHNSREGSGNLGKKTRADGHPCLQKSGRCPTEVIPFFPSSVGAQHLIALHFHGDGSPPVVYYCIVQPIA